MSIQKVVTDQEEYSWAGEGSFALRGWKAVSGGTPVLSVTDEKGEDVEAETHFYPRPDVAEQYPEYQNQKNELGYLVTVGNLKKFMENHQKIEIFIAAGDEKRLLYKKTTEELKTAFQKNSIRFQIDECTLSDGKILIHGWILDALGEESLAICDECGNPVKGELKRSSRRDVVEALGYEEGELIGYKAGFWFTMPRSDFHGETLVFTMKNRYVTKTYKVVMKTFDRENSKPYRLKKLLGRENWRENRAWIKKRGLSSFANHLKEELLSEEEQYQAWLKGQRPGEISLLVQKQRKFAYAPLISIVIPLYNTPQPFLRKLLTSITSQSYGNWELCLADGSTKKGPSAFVKKFYGNDKRIRLKHLKVNGGISENTNEAIRMAKGEFLMFADHDDFLEPDALYEFVKALNENPKLDLLYSDEDLCDEKGERFFFPRFKPDFNPDFLRSINYICHLVLVRRSLANEIGLLRKECDGAQDYDFLLRCIEKTDQIHHIPKVLYHWRASEESTAGNQDSKAYAIDAGKRALTEHYARLGYEAEVSYTGIFIMYSMMLAVKENPLVTVLIPNKDQVDTLDTCLTSIFEKTDYPNYEILIIENNSEQPETFAYYEKMKKQYANVRVVTYEGGFNYSAINNFGVRHAKGDYLLFLNNDTEVISPFWMREMLGFCQREDTAAVGAKLYYPDDLVQHAGVVVGIANFAGHVQSFKPKRDNGYFGRLRAVQDISAVTAACMMVKRSAFEQVGGFDEDFVVSLNDVDLCLRLRELGLLIVQDSNVELYHYESKSRGYENTPEKQERFRKEILRFRKRWKEFLKKGDPYYSPNLTLVNGECTLRKPGEYCEVWEELFPNGEEE